MKSTNFEFLRPENEMLANLGGLAEAVLHIDAGSALTRLRGFAEEVTKVIYQKEQLPRLPQAGFYELVKNPVFESSVSKALIHQIHFLRVQGNDSAHGADGDVRSAQIALGTAYQLAMYMAIKYYNKAQEAIPTFQDIKAQSSNQVEKANYEKELQKQQEAVQMLMEQLEIERAKNNQTAETTVEIQQKSKQDSQKIADSLQWSEAKTRALLIDSMLIQAGWDIKNTNQVSLEFEVDFPNNKSGKGYVDYVLWVAMYSYA